METRDELLEHPATGRRQGRRPLNEPQARASLRLPILLLMLLASLLVFLQVLPQDTMLFQTLTRPFRPSTKKLHEQYMASLRTNDPPLGTTPLLPRAGRPGLPTLAVFVGPCSPCIMETLKNLDQLSRTNRSLNVVLVSDAEVGQIKAFWKQYHLQVPAVADLDGQLSLQFNAAWKPRAYLLDAEGVLIYAQPDSELELANISAIAIRGVKG
jgi:peroxiredoxin